MKLIRPAISSDGWWLFWCPVSHGLILYDSEKGLQVVIAPREKQTSANSGDIRRFKTLGLLISTVLLNLPLWKTPPKEASQRAFITARCAGDFL
jgi:hypothetical protein